MRPILSLAAMLLFCCVCFASQVSAQAAPTPNFTEGAVSRVVLIQIKPGKTTDFWADFRQHGKPVYDAYKAAGIIEDYSVTVKSTTEGASDWNVSLVLTYKNFAALDGLTAKTDPITLKHYGSAAARTAAGVKRAENATTVGSFLMRHVSVNDWPK
jgi:hypothetical protein